MLSLNSSGATCADRHTSMINYSIDHFSLLLCYTAQQQCILVARNLEDTNLDGDVLCKLFRF